MQNQKKNHESFLFPPKLFKIHISLQAKSQFKRRSTANNVEIIIPVPSDADSPKFKTSIGSVKYTPEQSAFVWTVKSFPGTVCGQIAILNGFWAKTMIFFQFIIDLANFPKKKTGFSLIFLKFQ